MLDNSDFKHTEYYVMLIAFPWQQWLQECTSLLHYVYIDSRFVTGLSTAEQVASLVSAEQWCCLLNGEQSDSNSYFVL